MLRLCVDPDLPDAWPHSRHRLPVRRVKSLLDASQLKAGQSSRVSRKGPNVAARRTQPPQYLVGHLRICKYGYILSSLNRLHRMTSPLSCGSRRADRAREARGCRLEDLPSLVMRYLAWRRKE